MTRKYSLSMSVIVVSLIVGHAALLPAQAQSDQGALTMAIVVSGFQIIPIETVGQPATWQSYLEQREVLLNFKFSNESNVPLWINQARIREAIGIQVDRNGSTLPVSFSWLDELWVYSERVPVLVASEQVAVPVHTAATWSVALRRQDGRAFDVADYGVSVDVKNLGAAIRKDDAALWKGRVAGNGIRRFLLRIDLPKTPQDQALGHLVDAGDKALREEFSAALESYSRAAEIAPSNTSAIGGMANMLRRMSRYSEAIPLYEKAIGGRFRNNRISHLLALAYLGAGQETKAIDALRASGVTESELPDLLRELRERMINEKSHVDRRR